FVCARASTHPRPPSFPTRRSSDLVGLGAHAAQSSSTWVVHTTDLSGFGDADNVASLVIRITLGGATNANGNNRFDNVQINATPVDRKSTRLNSSHVKISYAVFCLK